MEAALQTRKASEPKAGRSLPTRGGSSVSAAAHPFLLLQQQAGNQAVQGLLRNGIIHPKLTISNPGDPDERQADRLADRVMRMPAGAPITSACTCTEGEESCEACRQSSATVQRREDGAHSRSGEHANVASVSAMLHRDRGRPLDTATRAFFEPRFGRDLSAVRVHTGSAAAESAHSIHARAYTFGRDVVFAPGQYNPTTIDGRSLLAHELAHTIQQGWGSRVRRQDDAGVPPPAPSSAAELDQKYQAELANGRQTGNWDLAAELLNGFDKEDIQARLAQLTGDEIASMHQGALNNPRVGPDSQIAQMTAPGPDANRAAQIACVARYGGCIQTRDAGLPTPEDIAGYNTTCRSETKYGGPDVTPNSDECSNLPLVPLTTGEKILLGAFLVTFGAVAVGALIFAGAEVIPVAIASLGEAATTGWVFYLSNAIAINEIGVFSAGLLMACSGDIAGLLRAMADDPLQAAYLLGEIYILHVNISIGNQPARPARVPVQLLPADEQTAPGQIRFRSVGEPVFEEQAEQLGGTAPPGQLPPGGAGGQTPALPALSPDELTEFMHSQRGFGSSPPGIPEPDPKGIGQPLGKGYETYAAIQIADQNGNQVAVGIGAYLGGGRAHGEEQAISALRAGLPKNVNLTGGKMTVAVEKEPCGGCDSAIKQLAKDLNLAEYDVFVPQRESMNDPTKSVTAKQAARTVFQGGRPPTSPKQVQ